VFVLLYDMGLLGVLVADQGRTVSAAALNVLLLLNPADVYRLLNLTSTPTISGFAGVAGLGAVTGLAASTLIAALAAWIVIPLAASIALFARRQV
jgi:Cu-processing system permease protein